MEEFKAKDDLPGGSGDRISRLRLTAAAPLIVAIVAAVLTIILLMAGTKPSLLQTYNLLALNSSKLGENIIQFSPATTAAAKERRTPQWDPFDPFDIFPTATASSSGSGATPTSQGQDPFNALENYFSGIVRNVTDSIDGDLNDAEAQLVAGVVNSLGIAEYYTLHLLKICSGNLSNPSSSDAFFRATNCVSYSTPGIGLSNLSRSISSSITVATTNVSIPILSSLATSGNYLGKTVTSLARALIAFYIIATIGSGITVLGSLIAIVLGRCRILVYMNIFFSALGTNFLLAGSIAVSVQSKLMAKIVNLIGNGIGLHAESGRKFIAVTWVAFAMILLAHWFWLLVWFVEFKTFSVVVRSRMPEQGGSYLGVFKETKDNLTAQRKSDGVVMGSPS